MSQHVEAIFENGILRPLTPIEAPEHARVQIDVTVMPIAPSHSNGHGDLSVQEYDRLLEELATSGPSVDSTFPRSEIYSDHV